MTPLELRLIKRRLAEIEQMIGESSDSKIAEGVIDMINMLILDIEEPCKQ